MNSGGASKSKRVCIEQVPELTTVPDSVSVFVKDGAQISMSYAAAKQSSLFLTQIRGASSTDGSDSESEDEGEEWVVEIQLPQLEQSIMVQIAQYMTHHTTHPMSEIPTPLTDQNLSNFVSDKFDVKLVSPQKNETPVSCIPRLCKLANAAETLGIPGLINLVLAALGTRLVNSSLKQCLVNFGMDPDHEFTEEEIAEATREVPWLRDQSKNAVTTSEPSESAVDEVE